MTRKKILILGGGLSGLTAGLELLEDGGKERYDVSLLCRDSELGGKAASWRTPDGRTMEIGFHAVFGYYTAIRSLLARVGRSTTDPRYFTSNRGEHLMYEPSARAVNRLLVPRGPFDLQALLANLRTPYKGHSKREQLAALTFAARLGAYLATTRAEDIDPALDELSFTEFCMSHGLSLSLTQKSWFKYVLDLAFNYPGAGSAYVGLYGFRKLMGFDAAEVLYLNGGLSEVIVDPIAKRYLDLGGRIETNCSAHAYHLDPTTRSIEAVDVAPTKDAQSQRRLQKGRDFDTVISALPLDATRTVLRASPHFDSAVSKIPFFSNMWHLRSVTSISLRLWSPYKLMPTDYSTVVMGTPQPTATIIDYANRVDELRDGEWPSVIEFEGQEGLHGELTDSEMIRSILEQFCDLPFSRMRKSWVDDAMEQKGKWRIEFRRNNSQTTRYLLMEPGHWKFRPDIAECPYDNLVLAGDWLKGTQPTASMEAAVRSGQAAAKRVELS
ncbi:MAG: NAD(P)-binding protein [Myxococcales bacterium]|nr:NAD(P)-binding protein [Myxococcales bacterium]